MNNKQIYIIGDVHGCYKTLLALIDQFPNKQNSKIVFVGDLIDKGTNSCEVVEFIINNKYDCVMGNHEGLKLTFNSYFYDIFKFLSTVIVPQKLYTS